MNSQFNDPETISSELLPSWVPPLLIFLVVLVGYGIAPTRLPLVGEETSRAILGIEMANSGDWLIATRQGVPLLDRPPMQYWTLGLIHRWVHLLDPLTLRFTMALVTLSTALVIFWYASRFLSQPGAFVAGVSYPTIGHVFDLGRRVETDGLFTLLLACALMVWHHGYSKPWPRYGMWIAGAVLAALATLTKGLQGPVAFFGAIYLFLLIRRDGRCLLSVPHLVGLVLFLVLIASWQVPFYLEAGWEGTRSIWLDPGQHRLSFELFRLLPHLATFPLTVLGAVLPWSILLLGLFSPQFWQLEDRLRSCLLFMLLAVAAIFAPVWIHVLARPRYAMPVYPFLAIVCGIVVQQCLSVGAGQFLGRLWQNYLRFMALMVASFVVFYSGVTAVSWFSDAGFVRMLGQPWWLMALLVVLATPGVITVFRAARTNRPQDAMVGSFMVALLVAACFNGPIVNMMTRRAANVGPDIVAFHHKLPLGTQLVSFEALNHKFIYWYSEPIPILPWPETPADLPDDVVYFAVNIARQGNRELPFAWEPIARFNMDKRAAKRPHDSVWIGRRMKSRKLGN